MNVNGSRGKARFQFREIAARYRMIVDMQVQVLIPFNAAARQYWTALNKGHIPFVPQRHLQPFLVGIPERSARALETQGAVRAHESGVWLLLREDAYNNRHGLHKKGEGHGIWNSAAVLGRVGVFYTPGNESRACELRRYDAFSRTRRAGGGVLEAGDPLDGEPDHGVAANPVYLAAAQRSERKDKCG